MMKRTVSSVCDVVSSRNTPMLVRLFLILLASGMTCLPSIGKNNVRIFNKSFIPNNLKDGFIPEKCIGDCFLLYNEIIKNINKSINPCESIHSYMCSNNKFNYERKTFENIIPSIYSYITGLLISSLKKSDSGTLKMEKQLYQNCIRLGDIDIQNQEDLAFETLSREIKRFIKSNGNWTDLDIKLANLGFGHAFFDIRVIPDPAYPMKNIVMLQPPSTEDIQEISMKISDIMFYKDYYYLNANIKDIEVICELYDFIPLYYVKSIKNFFNNLREVVTLSVQKYTSKGVGVRITLQELDKLFIQFSETGDFAQMEWKRIIRLIFAKVNINIKDDDHIILINKPYFIDLAKLLNKNSNNVIAIITKIITENLPLINWNLSQILETNNKSWFCLKQTKLYGASHKFLYDSINADTSNIFNFKVIEHIIMNIVESLNNKILESYAKDSREQIYLNYKLKTITDNIFEYIFYPSKNFHDNFELTPSNFFNLIKYKQILKMKEFRSLQDTVHDLIPFSIINLDVPRNNFYAVLNMIANNDALISPTLPRSIHYGNFGATLAGLLYSLLNENNFEYNRARGGEKIDYITNIKYSNNSSCISSKGIIKGDFDSVKANNIITEIFGLQIAYEAMLREPYTETYDHFIDFVLLKNQFTKTQLFLLTYMKSRCYMDSDAMNMILYNSDVYSDSFNCNNFKRRSQFRCPLKAFDIDQNLVFPINF